MSYGLKIDPPILGGTVTYARRRWGNYDQEGASGILSSRVRCCTECIADLSMSDLALPPDLAKSSYVGAVSS